MAGDTNALRAVAGRPELAALQRGIEKESLRVTPAGELAQTPHPPALGSPLTHPHITTDFSEAQLELITGVHASAEGVVAELEDIHRFVCTNIGDELLWAASMPCRLGAEEDIPIARFGASNVGRSKTVYRNGLSHRYGRRMQAISGIHYNFSVPETLWPAIAESRGASADRDFVTSAYFGLIRNFRRYSWLLIHLFGASPAVCRSFIADGATSLQPLGDDTAHLANATSLRMGRLGYQSEAQATLRVSYDSLDQYDATMRKALTATYPPYKEIGLKGADGDYRQLSTALLQIENEFYAAIRPKRRTRSGERPLNALRERGVEYVEVRCIDLDPFLPLGIDATTCRFLDVFLLFCLLADSPAESVRESDAVAANQLAVVERGREANLPLRSVDGTQKLERWAKRLLDGCAGVALVVDAVAGDGKHVEAVDAQRRKVEAPERTPSAKVLAALAGANESFSRFGLRQSAAHRRWIEGRARAPERQAALAAASAESHQSQAAIEAADSMSFDDYLRRFLTLDA